MDAADARWGGRRGRLLAVALLGVVAVLALLSVLLLGGDGPDSSPPAAETRPTSEQPDGTGAVPTVTAPSATSPQPTEGEGGTPGPGDAETAEFEAFVAACADSFEGWRPGQARYPRTLDIDLDGSRTYTARIDIRPGAPQQPAPDPATATAELQVRCGIGARLVAVGSSVSVDDEDWFLREFGDPGEVQWDWTVTASAPRDAELRLELRPAVAAVDGSYTVPAESNPNTATTSFTTAVHVRTSFLQAVGRWFDENWPIITTVFVALGGAVLGLVRWLRQFRSAVGGDQQPTPVPAGPSSAGRRIPLARRRKQRKSRREPADPSR